MISNGIRFFLHVLAVPALLLGALSAPPSVAERAAGPDGAQTERLTPEQAIAVALNDPQATADGYRLRPPRHVANFTPDGAPSEWRPLISVGLQFAATIDPEIGADFRVSDMGPDGDANYDAYVPAVAYNGTENEYLVVWHGDDDTGALVDEEFEIFGQLVDAATGAEIGTDLRLSDMGPDGDADYDASYPAVAYNSADNEYLVVWRGDDDTGALVNGEYEVFGQRVSATGAEIGTDFRLSDMGPDGNGSYDAYHPAVAYNSAGNEYLVVWEGEDNTGELAIEEREIFGQRVDAATGAEIGTDLRLSDMGPDGDVNYDAWDPAVAYDSVDNEYLVVWAGDDDTGGLTYNEDEIFGQRVNAATGAEIGTDLRLSDMGPDGSMYYDARDPAVAYNSANNEYLVVWASDDDTGALVDEECEIFGQRVEAATGAEIGANDFRLSDMGPDGDATYDAWNPAVAYDSTDNEYLVVWEGEDDTGTLVSGEFEIYGQRVEADTGMEIGTDLRLSDMGPDGDATYDALYPAVACSSAGNEYLVVWHGDDDTGALVDEEYEIFGQRVDVNGEDANDWLYLSLISGVDEVGHVDESPNPEPQDRWDEQVSRAFIDYGRYVVPERERQVQTIVDLLPRFDGPCTVVELCCGEGLLAEAILDRFPTYTVHGFDGSSEMLRRARERLARFGERFQARPFDLAARSWRDVDGPVHAVVTSLALHHLDGPQKRLLFRDVYGMLAPGGAFTIADVVEPAHPLGWELAADAWDEAVRERALELDGTTEGFDFFERERWNMYRYFDPEDIDKPSRLFDQQKWLEQAGFAAVDVYWMRAGHAIFGGWKPAQEGRP